MMTIHNNIGKSRSSDPVVDRFTRLPVSHTTHDMSLLLLFPKKLH